MRIFATIISLLLLSFASASGQSDTPQGPQMRLEVASHDFGTMQQGGEKVSFDFEFTNDGTAPLIITNAKNSCRCISVTYPKRPVKAGDKGVVKVTFDPKDKGVFHKAVEIHGNLTGGHLTLIVKGEVK